jgi:predicted nucleic acid-binding protein
VTEFFADSFYFIALINPSDQHHAAAREASRQLAAPLVTTSWVLIEVADALAMQGMRRRVVTLVRRLETDPNVLVIPLDKGLFDRGFELYDRRPDKSWSLTDCISFVVMTERGLTDALTGDHHFEQAGFRTLMRLG